MQRAFIKLKPLQASDISFGMHLKSLAGWNQLTSDWEILLGQSSGGSYVAWYKGQKAGTVTTIQYEEKFSWIGMVLVDPKFRRMGIGTQLLQAAIDFARPQGPVLLDATPKGRELYKTMDFEEVCYLERLEAQNLSISGVREIIEVKKLNKQLLDKCITYDAEKFGARRGNLLRELHQSAPEYGFSAFRDGKVAGFCLGRHGSQFEQIGPIVADDCSITTALFENAIGQVRGKPVIMDVMCSQSQWYDYLLEIGFNVQRPFIRMRLGEGPIVGDFSCQYAIAGPEFG